MIAAATALGNKADTVHDAVVAQAARNRTSDVGGGLLPDYDAEFHDTRSVGPGCGSLYSVPEPVPTDVQLPHGLLQLRGAPRRVVPAEHTGCASL